MSKFFLLSIPALFLLFMVNTLSVSAEGGSCTQLFENNCAECHELNRGCALLGQPPKEWEELFEFMESMGADIDQQKRLIGCLSKPDDGVKSTCSKL